MSKQPFPSSLLCENCCVDDHAAPRPGELLISTSVSGSGIFDRSVVVLLDVEAGALGVIVNVASEVPVRDVLPEWHRLVDPPAVLFAGGPVSPNGAICVAKLTQPSIEPPGFHRSFDDLGLVHLDTPVELLDGAFSNLRVFAGYAGWDVGQLEGELAAGMWVRAKATDADIFGLDQATLWRRMMQRHGGEHAVLAGWTATPEFN